MTSLTPLLPKIARGDTAAIVECVSRYENLVWSLSCDRCPDRQTAEDAVQEIFLKLWEIADRFDASVASETTFVVMIARRSLIDRNRKRAGDRSVRLEPDSVASPEMDVSRRFELNDEAARAAAFLQQLPDDQQSVIRLSVYDGLSNSRIAEATGLALGTVKTHLRRGLISLRDSLFKQPIAGQHDVTSFSEHSLRHKEAL